MHHVFSSIPDRPANSVKPQLSLSLATDPRYPSHNVMSVLLNKLNARLSQDAVYSACLEFNGQTIRPSVKHLPISYACLSDSIFGISISHVFILIN